MKACKHILVTSGNGPAECHYAVAHVIRVMTREADALGVDIDVNGVSSKHGFRSAVVALYGDGSVAFASRWTGTILWRAKSCLRPGHKRANWFIGAFELPAPPNENLRIDPADVAFETFRAGGPGGQHQNTTDSAVRATHSPTGLSTVARSMRSQHRNRALALQRLEQMIAAQAVADQQEQAATTNRFHQLLERGNPKRVFKGRQFLEVNR